MQNGLFPGGIDPVLTKLELAGLQPVLWAGLVGYIVRLKHRTRHRNSHFTCRKPGKRPHIFTSCTYYHNCKYINRSTIFVCPERQTNIRNNNWFVCSSSAIYWSAANLRWLRPPRRRRGGSITRRRRKHKPIIVWYLFDVQDKQILYYGLYIYNYVNMYNL